MARLFTKSDLERCARLCALHKLVERDPEVAIAKAVAAVADEAPPHYSEEQVRAIVQYVLEQEDVDDVLEEALELVQRL